MAEYEDDTIELLAPQRFSDQFFAPELPRFNVRVAAATHPGKVRPRNEDHHAVMRRTRACEMLFTNLPLKNCTFSEDEAYTLIVADGIGGAAFGDLASKLALQTVIELSSRATSWLMKASDRNSQEMQQRVHAYVEQIQLMFRQQCEADPRLREMGTTLTAACLLPPNAFIVHVGDSRAYLYRAGQLKQITHDQTLAQEMIDAGAHPESVQRFKHVLTNSLGGDLEHVEADVLDEELQAGDRLLLCTDGLSDMADDAAIARLLSGTDPQTACEQLVQLALDNGGKDNITVVVCDLLPA